MRATRRWDLVKSAKIMLRAGLLCSVLVGRVHVRSWAPGTAADGLTVLTPRGFRTAELGEKVFKNTFAPGIDGETIGVGMVIAGLRHGTILEADLPGEVHAAVADELERRERELVTAERVMILLIGTMGEVRGRALLQKYAFLVDVEMYSRKTRAYYTMFGWKPHKSGPHSVWPGRYVDKAVRNGLVEEFPIASLRSGDSVGYRLTSHGKEMFDSLLGVFQKDVDRMRDVLAEFALEQSSDRVTSHIYENYPEYADKNVICNRVGRGQ